MYLETPRLLGRGADDAKVAASGTSHNNQGTCHVSGRLLALHNEPSCSAHRVKTHKQYDSFWGKFKCDSLCPTEKIDFVKTAPNSVLLFFCLCFQRSFFF